MPKLPQRKIKGYGWKPQLPDGRDYAFAAPRTARVPSAVDLTLRPYYPPVYDQLQLGSCTANALGGAFEFEYAKQGHKGFIPSRLFVYYNERVIERTVSQDAGAELRDGAKVLNKLGAPHETLWRYSASKFAQKPSAAAFADGLKHQVTSYKAVSNSTASPVLAAIAAGYLVAFGFTAYESLESEEVDATGILPMPAKDEEVIGGHAVCLVSYDQSTKMFGVRNSWGKSWSAKRKGHFLMPFDYVLSNLASDFWTLQQCE